MRTGVRADEHLHFSHVSYPLLYRSQLHRLVAANVVYEHLGLKSICHMHIQPPIFFYLNVLVLIA